MRHKVAPPDVVVAKIASSQHGVVSTAQLLSAGVSRNGIARRVRSGRLHRLHRGVYAAGHRGISSEGRWMAAVLACGEGAVLSHLSAAALWGLINETKGRLIEVSTPKRSGRARRSGIRLHRCSSLLESEITKQQGILTTTPARTIGDLRPVVSERLHRRVIRQADVLGLQLGSETTVDGTRSELEYLFLRLCRRYRLPAPEVNVRLGSLLADFVWREKRLVVETDGYQFHRGRAAFEDDHGRDLHFRALGYEVIRLSYRQVVDEPKLVAGVLTGAIAA